jgi:CRISPR-associated endonuclease/helicase Cas3
MVTQAPANGLFANSVSEGKRRRLKQSLDDHLWTVGKLAQKTVWRLFRLVQGSEGSFAYSLPGLSLESVQKMICTVDTRSRFNWQNRCAEALIEAHKKYQNVPHLVFNTAATGSGKTRMNCRAIAVLSCDSSPRMSIALNLRSLTLQTGKSIETSLGIDQSELAVVIGDLISQELFDKSQNNSLTKDDDENPFEPQTVVEGDEYALPFWLKSFLKSDKEKTLLGAPLLVSTVDYLSSAGNPGDQGRHVKAALRCMSSDLILDEIDSYEPESLAAVLRLVQLAAFFRRNVVCSSATLSVVTAKAIDNAFASGIRLAEELEHADSEGEKKKTSEIGYVRSFIDDELPPKTTLVGSGDRQFAEIYSKRLEDIAVAAEKKPKYRFAKLSRFKPEEVNVAGWQSVVLRTVCEMHRKNLWQFGDSGKTVSFGLIRVANVAPAIELSRFIAEGLPNTIVACYHAADFRISRFEKERRLDFLLSRHDGNKNILNDSQIRSIVNKSPHNEIIFVLVATPVEEVGRDHDFDWAVIEPSSAQSIVQTSGRVNRHRLIPCNQPNIAILQYNRRHCHNKEKGEPENKAFCWPGFEEDDTCELYENHDLSLLLPWKDDLLNITAKVRFDGSTCKFAAADDEQIEKRINPFFGEKGIFVSDLPHSWLLTGDRHSPYGMTPLRQTEKKQLWKIRFENEERCFDRLERKLDPNTGFPKSVWIPQSGLMKVTESIPSNAWLVTDPEGMVALCQEFSVDQNEGLQLELSEYNEQQEFEYDIAFGVKRHKL